MSITSISKGVFLYLILVIASVVFMNVNEFVITERQFTGFLVLMIFLIGFYTGFESKTYSSLNGFLIGAVSSVTILLMISPYISMKWDLNFMILVVWITVSIAGSFLGSYLYKIIDKKRVAIINKNRNLNKVKA